MKNSGSIRVRFAPSPTGYLHVGGLRTALYNYLYAKSRGGIFILRIEDTDRSRYVEGAVENLVDSLAWVGLYHDEGPGKGGEYGPYIQSERTELYRKYTDRLLETGWAYRSFASPEELEELRSEQQHQGGVLRDTAGRTLSEEESQAKLAEGQSYTVRLKVPPAGDVQFRDMIRGNIAIGCDTIDDQVLLKSDGFPTYHLANVVDDHLMGITHVIRGEEWLPSTPKHVLLYQAFGWDLPEFAHLPLLLNPDKTKLSKRQGDVAVEDYRAKGYLPEAILNFVALLGWSPGNDRELFTLKELGREFSLDRVGKSGAVFDIAKLDWYNGHYLREVPLERRTALCLPHLREAGFSAEDDESTRTIVDALTKYLNFPADIVEHAGIFYEQHREVEDEEAWAAVREESAAIVLRALLSALETVKVWSRDTFKEAVKSVQKETGIKGKQLFMPIRVALTGKKHGPDIPVIAEIFGRETCTERINDLLTAL
jgi:nondiscriminating glutamyl-tRNA synthetase